VNPSAATSWLRRQEHALERRVRPVAAHRHRVVARERRDRERFRAGELERELIVERARLVGVHVAEHGEDSRSAARRPRSPGEIRLFVADRERGDAADAARVGDAEHEARCGPADVARFAVAEPLGDDDLSLSP
jgi:hypothetical protein